MLAFSLPYAGGWRASEKPSKADRPGPTPTHQQVPAPSQQQANATVECVAKCPTGTGTAADNLNYRNCVDACIARNFFSASGGTPNPTTAAGGSGSGSGSGSISASASGSAKPSGSAGTVGTQTAGGAPEASTTANAAANVAARVAGGSALGALGFLAALLVV